MMGSFVSKISRENIHPGKTESDDECFHDAEDELITEVNNKMNVQRNCESFQTDAVESSKRPNLYVSDIKITYETIREIEWELTFYEKVSLVFLMFEQADVALQSLLIEKENLMQQTTINVLYEWAQSKHQIENSWKKKIIEGLCIIQNYSLLERLGYNKADMIVSYLPSNPYTSVNINMMYKALYCLCESLTIQQIKLFLQYLEEDFKNKQFKFIKFEEIHLEMYLLQCYSVKYIDNNDISNIICILKKMNLYQQIEMLQSVSATYARRNVIFEPTVEISISNNGHTTDRITSNNVREFDLISNFNNNTNVNNQTTTEICSDYSVISNNSLVKTISSGEHYTIDPENVGICLIINQYKFYPADETNPKSIFTPKEPLLNRDGTEYDRDKLKETFTKFNFRIVIEENLTDTEIEQVIKNTMKTFTSKDSCFFVCILSHGEKGSVFGVNSIPVFIEDLENMIRDVNYTTLLGKPKVLIIQSCQGKALQKVHEYDHNNVADGVTDNPSNKFNEIHPNSNGVPQSLDLLVLMSTVAGYASVRNKENGTWFIQELCKVMEERGHEKHFEDIMTITTCNVSSKQWHTKDKKIVTMVPEKRGTLSKYLHLPIIQKDET